jgi:excisionase family DNA binding protein
VSAPEPGIRLLIRGFGVHRPVAQSDADRPSASLSSSRPVLAVDQAGELLEISRVSGYELVARGELPVVRFGRRIVVPKAALHELLGLASLDG